LIIVIVGSSTVMKVVLTLRFAAISIQKICKEERVNYNPNFIADTLQPHPSAGEYLSPPVGGGAHFDRLSVNSERRGLR